MSKSPQKENGYTPIANEILDALVKVPLQSSERRVLDVIFRKTYGFNKKEDDISLSQLEEATGLGKRSIVYATQNLEAKNMILVVRTGFDTNRYGFQKDYEMWVVQRNAPQYEAMLAQKREKYQNSLVKSPPPPSAEKAARVVQRIKNVRVPLVQRNAKSSAEKPVKVVQRRDEKGRFSAHTKDKNNKRQQKTGKRVPVAPVRVENIDVEAAREARDIIEAFTLFNPAMKTMYGNTTQRNACANLVSEYGFQKVMDVVVRMLPKTNKQAFFPTITTPHQLFQDWARLEAAGR